MIRKASDELRFIVFVPTLKELKTIFGIEKTVDECGLCIARYKNTPIIVTGIGKSNTAATAAIFFSSYGYKKALLTGICGAYHGKAAVGDVVTVRHDYFVDEASLYSDSLVTIAEKGMAPAPDNRGEFTPLEGFTCVDSNTVSLIPCRDDISSLYMSKTDASIENMEGAAFALAANKFGIKPYQLRAVSNYCGEPSSQSWDIKLAAKNLRAALQTLLS